MIDSFQALLDNFPEGIVQIREDTVLQANSMACYYFPQLSPGTPIPDFFPRPRSTLGAGCFSCGPACYNFSCSQLEDSQILLFRPAPQTALTGQQLEGALHQLRGFLSEFLAEIGPATAPGDQRESIPSAAFSKSFHRAFRLLRNLEYMQQSAAGGVPCHLVTMDLDGLCRQVTEAARDLLSKAGISLEYEGTPNGFLIPGDPTLLRHLLLGLIANSAKAIQDGHIILSLRRSSNRAMLTLSDNGPLMTPKQLSALLQQGGGPSSPPLPTQGAGLGLSIARDIAALHHGSLLMELGPSSPVIVLSLPTGPLNGRATVSTPRAQWDGGLDPTLVSLSDVLPAQVFSLEGLE